MRVLTYNLWHGLTPSHFVRFAELEPASRRHLREAEQARLMRELQPDFCFLQEANPVRERAQELRAALEGQVEYHPDLVGTKMLGVGVPWNLNSGQVIVAGRKWPLKGLGAHSLDSEHKGWVSKWGSWQLSEQRWAVFAESLFPNWGRVLLASTHLHHGLEDTPDLRQELKSLVRELGLSENVHEELLVRLRSANQRREKEWDILKGHIEANSHRLSAVILAGDLNASPASDLLNRMQAFGFKDTWAMANDGADGFTYDRVKNEANHKLQEEFPSTFAWEDLTFDKKVRDRLTEFVRNAEFRRRRIDYVLVRSEIEFSVSSAQLIGLPVDGLAPSDHFGVCVDLQLKR